MSSRPFRKDTTFVRTPCGDQPQNIYRLPASRAFLKALGALYPLQRLFALSRHLALGSFLLILRSATAIGTQSWRQPAAFRRPKLARWSGGRASPMTVDTH